MRTGELVRGSVIADKPVPGRGLQTGILAFVVLISALATLPFNIAFLMPALVAIGRPRVDLRLRWLVGILSVLMIISGSS